MKHFSIGPLSALAALFVSTSAFADVTADQVWQNWKALMQGYGQTLTVASENRAGDALTVTGLALDSEEDGSTMQARIDSLVFRERGDGTVEVTMSPQYPVTLTVPDDEGNTAVINIVVDQPGLVILASGTDVETRYDITAPTVNVAFTAPATAASPAETQGNLALAGLAGEYLVTTDVQSRIASTLQADTARLTVAIVDPTPQEGGTSNIALNLNTLTSTTQGVVLPPGQMEDMSAALASGFSTEGSFGYASADFTLDATGTDESGKASGTIGEGTVNVGLSEERLAYGGTTKDVTVALSGTGITVPELVVSFADSAFDLMMPVAQTEDPQDFRLLLRMVDLAVSEEVWAQFDPGAVLPRDPATLVIDTSGKAKWLVDMFSPETETTERAPGELHALEINDLTLRALGAAVVGQGAFTFDNSDTTTFDGMPLPTGQLDLTITGANALLDRLAQVGILPAEQVMGARMMMGLFSRPGAEPDTVTSTLEFRDKGFFANGQRLQ